MPPDSLDAGYLHDMLEHARGILRAVDGIEFKDYTDDEELRLAVERRLEIIGEAAKRISQEFRDEHPGIPWGKIISQRNVLAHEYGEIDDQLVWRVAIKYIPDLTRRIAPLIPPEPGE